MLFQAKPESTNIDRDALARAARPVFLLARSARFMVWFPRTLRPRLRNIVRMVLVSAFLKSLQAARNRGLWHTRRFNL